MTTKEMIVVMQAYEEGRLIQQIFGVPQRWEDVKNPCWNWADNAYRIKPKEEPKTIPATKKELNAIELLGKIIKPKKVKEESVYRLNYLRLLLDGSNTPKDIKDNYFVFNPETKCWEDLNDNNGED